MKIQARLLILFFFVFSIPVMSTSIENEVARYYRCYGQMVRKQPAPNDSLLTKIRTGQLSAVDACMEVLELANLNDNGLLLNSSTTVSNGSNGPSVYEKTLKNSFSSTLHPHLRSQNCVSCHAGQRNAPSHSSSDSQTAFDAIINNNLVDFDDSSKSKLVTKVANGHNCNGSNCLAISEAIKIQIQNWEQAFNVAYQGEPDKNLADDTLTDGGYPEIGQRVLKTFNDFHRSWMGADENFSKQQDCVTEMHDVYDSGLFSLYITQSLFTEKPYKNVVTSNQSLKAVRYSPRERSPRSVSDPRYKIAAFKWGHPKLENGKVDYKNGSRPDHWIPPEMVELGLLIGITEREDSIMPKDYLNLSQDLNMFETIAGAMGSPSYLMLNNGVGGSNSNGGLRIQRRWSRAVFNDFLCRDVPVVRSSDAIKYLDTEGKSDMSFRGGISCMKCHSSMDPAARVARNTQMIRSYNDSCNGNGNTLMIRHHVQTKPEHPNEYHEWIDQNDNVFHLRPNLGKFYFRSHDGTLHDKEVDGFDGLGAAIADTEDYYMCAAKRYLYFFTGVDIPMFDEGDLNAPALNSTEKKYRLFIKSLGKDLKEKQDLKNIVRRIIASDAYLKPGESVPFKEERTIEKASE